MALHCFWIISRPFCLTLEALPHCLTSMHISESSPTHPLYEPYSLSTKQVHLSCPLNIGHFSALCFYNSSAVHCWGTDLESECQDWKCSLSYLWTRWPHFLHLKNGDNKACFEESFLIRSASTWRNIPWGGLPAYLHTCVHVYTRVHMPVEKQCCSSIKGHTGKTNTKNSNR